MTVKEYLKRADLLFYRISINKDLLAEYEEYCRTDNLKGYKELADECRQRIKAAAQEGQQIIDDIGRLNNPLHREILYMHYIPDQDGRTMPLQEIAKDKGYSVGYISNSLTKAIKELESLIGERLKSL